MKWLKNKAVLGILWAIPYAIDLEYLNWANTKFDGAIEDLPVLGWLLEDVLEEFEPEGGAEWAVVLFHVLGPYMDREMFKLLPFLDIPGFFGIEPFKPRASEDSYVDEDGNIVMGERANNGELNGQAARRNHRMDNRRRGSSGGSGGGGSGGGVLSFFGKFFGKFTPILLIVGVLILLVAGVGMATGTVNVLGYVGLAGDQAATQATALGGTGRQLSVQYKQTKAWVTCAASGPACLRRWRLNNTVRPGSKDRGERYGLNIDRFSVGAGKQIDIAFKQKDYAIPVSFGLSNTRRGLKGINALDVAYRIKFVDFDNRGDEAFCDTGWKPVDGSDINGESALEQITGDATGNDGDDIYPGLSASTGFQTITKPGVIKNSDKEDVIDPEALNLENCEMLQAVQDTKVAVLQVRYDYSSQATLPFEAMSREHLRNNPDVEKDWKESFTADTPVTAAINVNSPVVYFEDENGELKPQPFAIRSTLNTDELNVRYKVKPDDFKIRMSSAVERADTGEESSCALDPTGEDGFYELERGENTLRGILKKKQEDSWWDKSNGPPIFGCNMQLKPEELESISPSGETLTAHVKANYTVSLTRKMETFKILNSRCGEFNCPFLFATEIENLKNNGFDTEEAKKAHCDGIDAGNGCVGVESYSPTMEPQMVAGEKIKQNEYAVFLPSGARSGEEGEDSNNGDQETKDETDSSDSGGSIIGLEKSDIEKWGKEGKTVDQKSFKWVVAKKDGDYQVVKKIQKEEESSDSSGDTDGDSDGEECGPGTSKCNGT